MTDTSLSHPVTPAPALDEHHLDPRVNLLGMWIFLSTEVMFFGALFAGYLVYRRMYPEAFIEASRHLNVPLGAANTAILLTSSLTMALAVYAAQMNRRKLMVGLLLATIGLGAAFLGLKGIEYAAEFRENLFPGLNFAFEGQWARQAMLFFSLYFIMTGLHGLHMLIGMTLLLIQAGLNLRRREEPVNPIPVEMVGLFWHFVDLVWIFIFPLLYLIHPQL